MPMRRTLLLTAITLLAACGSPLNPPPGDLETSRSAWNAMRLTDYEFPFQRECFCVRDATIPVTIRVAGGRVVQVRDRETGQPLAGSPVTWPTVDEILNEIDARRADGWDVQVVIGSQGLPTEVQIGSLAADAGMIYHLGHVVQTR